MRRGSGSASASASASATRYCTPIVTTGNDRSRVNASASSFHNLLNSNQSDQNYRPSPPSAQGTSGDGNSGGNVSGSGGRHDEYDSHMRYYHRPYPTLRGGQPSPTRYEDSANSSAAGGAGGPSSANHNSSMSAPSAPGSGASSQPPSSDHRYGPTGASEPHGYNNHGHGHSSSHAYGSHGNPPSSYAQGQHSPAYATPVFPRGGAPPGPVPESSRSNPHGAPSHGGHGHTQSHSQNKYPPPSSYYDPHGHGHPPPPPHHGPYPPPPPHSNPAAPYPRHDAPYPPPHSSYSPYGAPPPYGGQGYPSPYDHPHYAHGHGPPPPHGHGPPHAHPMHYNPQGYPLPPGDKKRRRDGGRKAPKPPKRKKMYSDFVGVTYNKTHAKFQACITHYRKQHYLGRYKLACDAAKAYDQSAKLLKGNGWKINFQSEKEYLEAKEKEFKEVVEKRQATGFTDLITLRKSYEATFPSEDTLREKLGLVPKPPVHHPGMMGYSSNIPVPAQGYQQQRAPMMQQPRSQAPAPAPVSISGAKSHQTPGTNTASLTSATSTVQPTPSTDANLASTTEKSQNQGQPAVTPSPAQLQQQNQQKSASLPKTSELMNEPFMSPGFAMASPSVNSLLGGGTPFSSIMPESSIKFKSGSSVNSSSENKRDLDMISSNIFQSPKDKMSLSTSEASATAAGTVSATKPAQSQSTLMVEEKDASGQSKKSEKGKGDLAAASALLTIARPN